MGTIPSYGPASDLDLTEMMALWQGVGQKSLSLKSLIAAIPPDLLELTTGQSVADAITVAQGQLLGLCRAIMPNQLGAKGNGASAAADQGGWATAMAELAASVSSLPTGSWDYAQFQNGILIEPGIYDAGGFVLDGNHSIKLVARIPGTVIIRIPAGQYFCTVTGRPNETCVDGIKFVGGKGAFKFTNTGNNVNLEQIFRNCLFYNYTECAVVNSADDAPMLTFCDNFLMGLPGAKTIGLSWGGYLDGGEIANNKFQQNSYHLVIGPRLSGRCRIRDNDFLSFGGITTLADVWIKPNNDAGGYGVNSGQGIVFDACGWGNEGINTAAPKILVANEDTTMTISGTAAGAGDGRWTYAPSTVDAGYVTGISIINCKIANGGTMTAPTIMSYITNVRSWYWENNKVDGGPATYIVQFPAGRAADYGNTTSVFKFNAGDIGAATVPAWQFSNATFAVLEDRAGFWPGDANAIDLYPVSDAPDATLIASGLQPGAISPYGGSSLINRVADPDGGTDWGLFASGGNGNGCAMGFTGPSTGGRVWVEMWVAQAPNTRTVSRVQVEVTNYTTGTSALKYVFQLPATGARLVLPVMLPASTSPTSWQVRLSVPSGVVAGTTDQFVTGWWIVNKGPGRLGRRRTLDLYPQMPVTRTVMSAVAGTPGTLPTGWSVSMANTLTGISYAVVKAGTDKLGAFLDLRIYGTSTHAGDVYIRYEPDGANEYTGTEAARFAHYVRLALVAGSFANFTVTASASEGQAGGTSGPVIIGYLSLKAGPSYLAEQGNGYTPTATPAIYGKPDFNLQNASAVAVNPYIHLVIPNGVTVDATLRIYLPDARRKA